MDFSSVNKLSDRLMNGSLKSLAGLDDKDILKGGNSVDRLHKIHGLYAYALELS